LDDVERRLTRGGEHGAIALVVCGRVSDVDDRSAIRRDMWIV
jgi:hypothetical protein